MAATLTFEIPDELADALAPLDGSLLCDELILEQLLRDFLYKAHEDLAKIADGCDGYEMNAGRLRSIAQRLEMVAVALEDIKGRSEFMVCRLRQLRNASGMTRQHVADMLSVDAREVGRWENDEAPIPEEYATILAGILGVTMEYLTGAA